MRIMTSNIWGDYFDNEVQIREDQLFRVYKKYNPDVIGFQEVTSGWYAGSLFENLSSEYRFIGTELFDSTNYVPIAVKKKYSLIAKGFEYLENTPDDSKAITWAILEEGQNRFAVCNTHFWWMRGKEEHNELRRQNAEQLSELMKYLKERYSCPVFAFGDMNSTMEEGAFEAYKNNGLQKLFDMTEYKDTICSTHGDPIRGEDGAFHGMRATDAYIDDFRKILGLPERKDGEGYWSSIDHIIALGEGFRVEQYRVIEDQEALDASDHSPVYADVSFDGKEYMEDLGKRNTVPGRNQVSKYVFFEGKQDGSPRVMFIGNSITYHAEKKDIGWFGSWGMAASSKETDYVHLVMKWVQHRYPDAAFCIVQAAVWESNYKGLDYDVAFGEARGFVPDIMISSVSENVPSEGFDKDSFKTNLKKLHEYLAGGNKNVRILRASNFFNDPDRNEAIKEYAQEEGVCYVDISEVSKDKENLAIGQFEHEGIQVHPGDKGMKCLAQCYIEALQSRELF